MREVAGGSDRWARGAVRERAARLRDRGAERRWRVGLRSRVAEWGGRAERLHGVGRPAGREEMGRAGVRRGGAGRAAASWAEVGRGKGERGVGLGCWVLGPG